MSDELAVAMNRLEVGETESVKQFKRAIRQSMEVFLRFTHRYWFHEVSNQRISRGIFRRMTEQLGNETLYNEVRHEVADMNDYLDTDSARRQANTILRLTVVTIFGLIGTVVTGFLGMNLIADADKPVGWRIAFFPAIMTATTAITGFTVVKSKRLAEFLDALSDEREPWREKWRALARTPEEIAGWRGQPQPRSSAQAIRAHAAIPATRPSALPVQPAPGTDPPAQTRPVRLARQT